MSTTYSTTNLARQRSELDTTNRAVPGSPPFSQGIKPMTHLYFEDVEVGTTCKAGPDLVPKEEIIQFAKQYDPVPRHLDEEAAARSIFRGLTACSAHTFSIFILLTTRHHPRLHVLAGMGWDELKLPSPVRPGDELDLQTALMEKRESKSKPDRGIVRNQIRLSNQKGEIVLQCVSTFPLQGDSSLWGQPKSRRAYRPQLHNAPYRRACRRKLSMTANGMVRPCSCPASKRSWQGAPKTRSRPCLRHPIPRSP